MVRSCGRIDPAELARTLGTRRERGRGQQPSPARLAGEQAVPRRSCPSRRGPRASDSTRSTSKTSPPNCRASRRCPAMRSKPWAAGPPRPSRVGGPIDLPGACWKRIKWLGVDEDGRSILSWPVREGAEMMSDLSSETAPSEPLVPTSVTTAESLRPGWVHLCNGLDPRRDGGMVPSILGMTGALSRLRPGVTIVTTTPSRIDHACLPAGLELRGPEADIEGAVRSSEVVHLHGLWQAQTRRGARAARAARVPVPDRGPRHGRALGTAAQVLEETRLHGDDRVQESPPGLVPSCPFSPGDRAPAYARSLDSDQLHPQWRQPLVRRGPAAPVVPGSGTSGASREIRPPVLREAARQERARSPGRGSRPDCTRPSGPASSCWPATTAGPGRRSGTGWRNSV